LQNHHAGEERENVTRRKGGDHLREESRKQSSEDPVCEAAEGLTLRTMTVGKYLGDENPDDRSLANGVRGDEGEDTNRHDAVMLRKKSPGNQTERADVSERADKEKRAATQPVNEPEADKRENEIGEADANGLQQRGFRAQPGKFKYAWGEIENRIDAGELVEKCNQDGEQNRFAKTACPEMCRGCSFRGRSHNLVRLGFDLGFRGTGLDAFEDFETARAIALPAQKPARTLGKAEAEQSIEKRGERGHTKHPAPGILTDACKERIGHESDQDTKNNVELEHTGESSTVFWRRNFRDVKRSYDGGDADAQAADDTRANENRNTCRQAGPDCTDKVKDADPQQRGFASESVSGPAAHERTDDGAVEGGSHRNPVEAGTQPPKRLNRFFRAGDYDRVKAEKESGERGCQRPEEDAGIHRWEQSTNERISR